MTRYLLYIIVFWSLTSASFGGQIQVSTWQDLAPAADGRLSLREALLYARGDLPPRGADRVFVDGEVGAGQDDRIIFIERVFNVRGEMLLEVLHVLKRIVILCIGHGTGFEPAIQNLRDPLHTAAALLAWDGYVIYEMLVQIGHGLARLLLQLLFRADADLVIA